MLTALSIAGTGLKTILMQNGALVLALLAAGQPTPVQAQKQDPLVQLINAYRASPGNCGGRLAQPAPPLAAHPALSKLTIPSGIMLDVILERAGYPVAQAEAISVSGARDAPAALAAISLKHCKTLLNPNFIVAGFSRSGENWVVVLARPAPPVVLRRLPDAALAGAHVLAAVNAARAAPRSCGAARFDAVPPLTWNSSLAQAALVHSSDMAEHRYFNHDGRDGRAVAQRTTATGYRWRLVGENIAAGQDTAEEVVAGWIDSPGHCVNIMNRNFSEMGAAFAVSAGAVGRPGRVYWTQVLSAPR